MEMFKVHNGFMFITDKNVAYECWGITDDCELWLEPINIELHWLIAVNCNRYPFNC